MRINVTARDIKLGTPGDCKSCPIARAIRRRFPRRYVCVHSWQFHIGRRAIYTPPQVKRFIAAFDYGERVRPFKFDLPIR